MEYLKPIETLQSSLKRAQKTIHILCALLAISIIGVPMLFRSGPYVITDSDSFYKVVKSKPWEVSTSRVEGFTKKYLTTRFEWSEETFSTKEDELKNITEESVFKKLKDSISSFKSISQNQKAKSYFTFEGYGFSNSDKKIEARITRVIRIKNIAAASPLIVRLSYQEVAVSEANPYGMTVTGIEEVEQTETDGGTKQ